MIWPWSRIRELELQVTSLEERIDYQRKQILIMRPYYEALIERHNGYGHCPSSKPQTPVVALNQLIGQSESFGVRWMLARLYHAMYGEYPAINVRREEILTDITLFMRRYRNDQKDDSDSNRTGVQAGDGNVQE